MTAILCSLLFAAQPAGDSIRPLGAEGKPLNLNFETGTLEHWTATGEAFKDQPIKGDTVAARRKDMKSNHQGQFWIGSYEKLKDKPKGTLTSVAFKVTHPWATYLIGGGNDAATRVEILKDGKVIHTASGNDDEAMHRVRVDLTKHVGQSIQIRLVDNATGGWGHINFDDFQFHAVEPKAIPKAAPALGADEYKNAGLTPEKAAAVMTVPEGFSVSLFAGEPDVHQPVAYCFDDRGRIWVVEAFIYPQRHKHPGPILPDAEKAKGDKILVFEDTDGDGKFDKKTVVVEGLNLVSGIEYGFGGLFVGAAPYLLHIPLKDDKAGEPVILLDGWGYEDTHETLNSFVWGPDGWLYGCHGVFTYSNVGKPGCDAKDRKKINAGVWRFHPVKQTFEVFAHGTSNPWGLDYNPVGDFFVEACVIPHLFHIAEGARYHRQSNSHYNPYTYIDIPTIADHLHYLGNTPHGGNNKSDGAGGGHAHCGLMCYQGGAWPKEYTGQLFMGNIHGRRINMDTLHPQGSTYVGRHGKDFLLANDAWARFIALKYGPDGNAFLIDWYDKQACHRKETEIWDRTNGRIYKISYRGTKPVKNLDLAKCSDDELIQHLTNPNEWYGQRARRLLQERYAGKSLPEPMSAKLQAVTASEAPLHRLRGLWALEAAGALNWSTIEKALSDKDEWVRAWGVRLGQGKTEGSAAAVKLSSMARDPSPVVRRHVASAWTKAEAPHLSGHLATLLQANGSDANDPMLRCIYWYLLEHLAASDPRTALEIAANANQPHLLALAARRAGSADAIALLVQKLGQSQYTSEQIAYLNGIREGLKSKRKPEVPQDWGTVAAKLAASSSPEVKSLAQAVSVAFGDSSAFIALRTILKDAAAAPESRLAALVALRDARDKELPGILHQQLDDAAIRRDVLKALAIFDHADTPKQILAAYPKFSTLEKRDAIGALAGKAVYAMALLEAIASKTVPATDVPAETIRLLRAFNNKELNDKVVAVWGTLRDTPADRKKLIGEWRSKLTLSHDPDLGAGRAVFAKACQQCHTLYGVGSTVGPDITGSNRADLAYLLENIFDPSAVIPKDYTATTFDLVDGRKITGIVKAETPQGITVATATETLTINPQDVEKRKASEQSMMPDDLTKQLTEVEVKNLFAYLRHPNQVTMKATPENAKDFFNGKDLTGWDGDKTVWSVENGELVGKTATGLKQNNFLKSLYEVGDFKLSLKVKLTPASENSGIQFRSVPFKGHEMQGPQADIGQGWWGKIYEESGRGLLAKEGGEKFVKKEEWNDYVVEAKGPTVKIWINGNLCTDYTDEKLARKGVIAVQVHSGKLPMEVRFKDIKLEVEK
jgi:putative membrane-bound dehydrogenase-like protein